MLFKIYHSARFWHLYWLKIEFQYFPVNGLLQIFVIFTSISDYFEVHLSIALAPSHQRWASLTLLRLIVPCTTHNTSKIQPIITKQLVYSKIVISTLYKASHTTFRRLKLPLLKWIFLSSIPPISNQTKTIYRFLCPTFHSMEYLPDVVTYDGHACYHVGIVRISWNLTYSLEILRLDSTENKCVSQPFRS